MQALTRNLLPNPPQEELQAGTLLPNPPQEELQAGTLLPNPQEVELQEDHIPHSSHLPSIAGNVAM